jgi:hypothetical protein
MNGLSGDVIKGFKTNMLASTSVAGTYMERFNALQMDYVDTAMKIKEIKYPSGEHPDQKGEPKLTDDQQKEVDKLEKHLQELNK